MVVLGKEQQDDALHPHGAHLQGRRAGRPSAYTLPAASASALDPLISLPRQQRDPAVSLRWEQESKKGPCFSQGRLCCYQHEVERPQCVHEELAPLVGKESVLEPLVDHGIHFLQPGR